MRSAIPTMKCLIPVCALIGGLALAPAADAGKKTKTHKLSGSVEGDPNSRVSMKVKVKKGTPKKVKDFAWENLDGYCDLDDTVGAETFVGEQSGSLSTSVSAFPSPFRVFAPYDQATAPEEVADISGTVKKKGKKVDQGLIAIAFNHGSTTCTAPRLGSRDFTASK